MLARHTPSHRAPSYGYGYSGFGAALSTSDIESLAKEAVDKSDPTGAAVTNVVNLFKVIPDFASQDAVALRASAIAAVSSPGKVASIQASLAAARVGMTAVVPGPAPAAPLPAVTGTKLSRGARIGIAIGIAGALAAASFGIGYAVGHR